MGFWVAYDEFNTHSNAEYVLLHNAQSHCFGRSDALSDR